MKRGRRAGEKGSRRKSRFSSCPFSRNLLGFALLSKSLPRDTRTRRRRIAPLLYFHLVSLVGESNRWRDRIAPLSLSLSFSSNHHRHLTVSFFPSAGCLPALARAALPPIYFLPVGQVSAASRCYFGPRRPTRKTRRSHATIRARRRRRRRRAHFSFSAG